MLKYLTAALLLGPVFGRSEGRKDYRAPLPSLGQPIIVKAGHSKNRMACVAEELLGMAAVYM